MSTIKRKQLRIDIPEPDRDIKILINSRGEKKLTYFIDDAWDLYKDIKDRTESEYFKIVYHDSYSPSVKTIDTNKNDLNQLQLKAKEV